MITINVSPTGITNFDQCPGLWQMVREGRQMTGTALVVGRTAHKAAWEVARIAWRSEDEIGLEDVEPVIEKYANRFPDFQAFNQISTGLRKYAERVNERRAHIAALEKMFELVWKVGGITIVLKGKLDELDLNEKKEWEVVELKTFGMVPTKDELKADPQTSHYAMLVRDWSKTTGIIWKSWYSLVHARLVQAPADEDDARAAKQFAQGRAEKMAKCIKTGRFPRVTGRSCPDCPDTVKCKAWKAERNRLGIPEIVPTLDCYVQARGRGQAWQTVKDRMKPALVTRVENAGGILVENGYRAEVKYKTGGLKDEYRKMTRAQLFDELTSGPSSTLLIKPTR